VSNGGDDDTGVYDDVLDEALMDVDSAKKEQQVAEQVVSPFLNQNIQVKDG
jgi:hypothetical protein